MTLSKTLKYAALGVAGLCGLSAHAGPEAYIGDVMLTANTFCPRGTVEANGSTLQIAQNTALFSLYGTLYGGDGRVTFNVPDLRGRAPVHYGQGPGLTNYQQGQKAGVEETTLNVSNIPSHTHSLKATTGVSNTDNPTGAYLAGAAAPPRAITGSTIDPSKTLAPEQLGMAGVSSPAPINNVQPVLAMRYCIFTSGVYPSRS